MTDGEVLDHVLNVLRDCHANMRAHEYKDPKKVWRHQLEFVWEQVERRIRVLIEFAEKEGAKT